MSDTEVDIGAAYEGMYAEEKESFVQIVKRARAKARDGEPLSIKEKWALTKAMQTVPDHLLRRGPSKATLKNLRHIIEQQFMENKTLTQISMDAGKSLAWASKLIRDNTSLYWKLAQEYANEIVGEKRITKAIISGKLARKLIKPAEDAVDVLQEIQQDGEQPAGARVSAASKILDYVEVQEKKDDVSPQVNINIESMNVIKDTLGLLRRGEIDVIDAEVVDD